MIRRLQYLFIPIILILFLSACTEGTDNDDCKGTDCEPSFCEQNPEDDTCKEDPNPDPVLEQYAVQFDTSGGSDITPVQLEEGATLTLPTNPEKDGYLFAGWYLTDTYDILFDNSSTIQGDLTLYAKWIELLSVNRVVYSITNDFDEIMDASMSGDVYAFVGRQGESMTEWDSRLEIHNGDNIHIIDLFGSNRDIFTKVHIIDSYIYVFGTTNSTDFTYGTKTTSDYDAVVLKFDTDGTYIDTLVLGGTEDNYFAEAVEQDGIVYLTYTINDQEGYNTAFVFAKIDDLEILKTISIDREISFLSLYNNHLVFKTSELYPEYPSMIIGTMDFDLESGNDFIIDEANTTTFSGFLFRHLVVHEEQLLLYMYRSEGRDYENRVYAIDSTWTVTTHETYLSDVYFERAFIVDNYLLEWYSSAVGGQVYIYTKSGEIRVGIDSYNGLVPLINLNDSQLFVGRLSTSDDQQDTAGILQLNQE